MSTKSIGGNYWEAFTENAWQLVNGMYQMTISGNLHGLGYVCHVEIMRYDGGKYYSVPIHYDIDTSGNITVYSAEEFDGIYYVKSGV